MWTQEEKEIIERSNGTHALAERAGLVSYDTAIPQDWFDEVLRVTGTSPYGHIVWSYDGRLIFGEPAAVTEFGRKILDVLEGNIGKEELHA